VQISLCLLFVLFDKRVVKNNNFNGERITSRENIKDIFFGLQMDSILSRRFGQLKSTAGYFIE